MNEFHGHMLGVRGIGAAAESQQSPAQQEAFRHGPAEFGQTVGLPREKLFADPVAFEKTLRHVRCEFGWVSQVRHRFYPLTPWVCHWHSGAGSTTMGEHSVT